MTASALLDGRIDWYGTFAALVAQNPVVPNGCTANTSDLGPVVFSSRAGGWCSDVGPPLGVTADPAEAYQQPTTGFSITPAAGVANLILDPAGTLATGTILTPVSPVPDDFLLNVLTTQTITGLTVTASAGQTLGVGMPTTLAANTSFRIRYRLALTKWFREA